MRILPFIPAILLSMGSACLHAQERNSVATRYGTVSAIPASEERSALLFQGKPIARMRGDAGLSRLALRAERDYVLADATLPGLNCRHEFVLVEVGAEGGPALSAPFGNCMTLFGARLQDGNAVVQLAAAPAGAQGTPRIHEFAFAGGQLSELPGVLDQCEASALAAASTAVALTPDEANKTVAGAGRAYFHSAPLEACRTAKVFLVPGDRVNASRETGAFVEIEYRNPKSGQVFKGWIRRDRLLDPAQ
ncbi:hypothetical protein SRABI118_01585 [Massilia sp. Bi118]|uniref:hypothetical protein n=1 Tax=Massilia sp. Bi118 TaxID=2822346 RepID=UPI001D413EAF|nr:hypothetical protein [Massilia sp. Bi118]CAH0194631.1 hypothetical protein SRABI118_01585 [Massilia sp. Bi118]